MRPTSSKVANSVEVRDPTTDRVLSLNHSHTNDTGSTESLSVVMVGGIVTSSHKTEPQREYMS